jgi:transcription initiation factor TFIIH subunit 4
MGITSQQIIAYLTTHAHPILRRQHPILPPTVVDQIRLWQIEGERMTSWQGFLIKMEAGSTREEYDKAVQYAEALGVLRKEFRTKGFFFVSRMEQMASYFRSQALKKKQQQQAAEAAQTAQAQAEKSRV